MANGLSVSAQMKDIMTTYGREAHEAVEASAKEAAEVAKNQLRNTSPKRSGHGEYARSWTVKKDSHAMVSDYIVYNSKHYQLTHLLENGHVIRNKKGTYGRTRPIKHIAPAEDTATQRFDLSVRTRLGGLR